MSPFKMTPAIAWLEHHFVAEQDEYRRESQQRYDFYNGELTYLVWSPTVFNEREDLAGCSCEGTDNQYYCNGYDSASTRTTNRHIMEIDDLIRERYATV
jgi:hypothetical protein